MQLRSAALLSVLLVTAGCGDDHTSAEDAALGDGASGDSAIEIDSGGRPLDDDSLGSPRIIDDAEVALGITGDDCNVVDFRGNEKAEVGTSSESRFVVAVESHLEGPRTNLIKGYLALDLNGDLSVGSTFELGSAGGEGQNLTLDDLSEDAALNLPLVAQSGTVSVEAYDSTARTGRFALANVVMVEAGADRTCTVNGTLAITGYNNE